MKKLFIIGLTILILTGCSAAPVEPDLTAVEAETMLNEGKDIVGKKVAVTVKDLNPASAFGYNIIDGEHLNFVSRENPKVEVNDKIIVTVTKVESMLGSFIISYDNLTRVK